MYCISLLQSQISFTVTMFSFSLWNSTYSDRLKTICEINLHISLSLSFVFFAGKHLFIYLFLSLSLKC